MTATVANGFISRGVASVTGRTYAHSIWIRRVSGSGNVILHGNDIGDTVVTTTTSWKRFSNTFVATDGNSYAGVRLGTSGDVIDVAFAQMEEVTGQANQNPSEYVSVGVKTASPYHGAGVDGVKYFDTQNGNTVASNVVTEATGAAIAQSTLKGYLAEGTRTNLALQSEACDNTPWSSTNATISANTIAAPDGRTTADKIVENTATGQHKCAQSISTAAGSALTFSVYAKKADRHIGVHLYNANNGTLTNGLTPTIGKVGQALNFNGTNSFVDLPSIAVLKPTGDYAVAFWYKGLNGSTETFIGHSSSVLTNFWYIDNTKAFFCGGTNCNSATEKTYTLPNDDSWHHLVASLDRNASPDTLTVYIDGVSQGTASGTANGAPTGWGSNTLIGAPSWNNSGYRQGPIDEVRIYNRALSTAEVTALYNLGR